MAKEIKLTKYYCPLCGVRLRESGDEEVKCLMCSSEFYVRGVGGKWMIYQEEGKCTG